MSRFSHGARSAAGGGGKAICVGELEPLCSRSLTMRCGIDRGDLRGRRRM